MRHGTAKDKAARLDTRNMVNSSARIGMNQFIDGAAERLCITQQCSDIAKDDPLVRVIRN